MVASMLTILDTPTRQIKAYQARIPAKRTPCSRPTPSGCRRRSGVSSRRTGQPEHLADPAIRVGHVRRQRWRHPHGDLREVARAARGRQPDSPCHLRSATLPDMTDTPPPPRLAPFLAQWDYIVETLDERLTGLTDEEYLWQPSSSVWTVRPGPDGKPLPDTEVWAPTGDAAPPRTIAWSIGHLGASVAERADWLDRLTFEDRRRLHLAADRGRGHRRDARRPVSLARRPRDDDRHRPRHRRPERLPARPRPHPPAHRDRLVGQQGTGLARRARSGSCATCTPPGTADPADSD